MHRLMIHIDEAKCSGCGDCVLACAEGALEVIDGKARLISDVYCDGLGACLPECPEGAISMRERDAAAFDEEAVREHLAAQWIRGATPAAAAATGFTCPSAQLVTIEGSAREPAAAAAGPLGHWPIKLRLVPPDAPFLRDADVVLMADCVPFARAAAVAEQVADKALLIGCPKFDDWDFSLRRLTQVAQAPIRSLAVVHMEVPCCSGYWELARRATAAVGGDIPVGREVVSVRGEVLASESAP